MNTLSEVDPLINLAIILAASNQNLTNQQVETLAWDILVFYYFFCAFESWKVKLVDRAVEELDMATVVQYTGVQCCF